MKLVYLVCWVVACAPSISALLEDNLQKSIGKTIELAIEQASIQVEKGTLQSSQSKCSVSAEITCNIVSTGKKCEDYIVPMDKCQNEDMTFTFEYCSKESSPIKLDRGNTNAPVDFKNLPKGSMSYIDTVPVDIILQDLLPGKCWKVVETRKIDTCKKMINASLKIEGWRGQANKGDYCFAWAFYRSLIKRPCAVEGQVSCHRTSTGEECSELIIPQQECGKELMTFTFNYCNNEKELSIILRKGNTNEIDDFSNLPVGTMAFTNTQPVALNMNNLLPGACRNIVKTREVNTCWNTIDASLKIEGWLGGRNTGSYCYSWDFYRANLKRDPVPPCQVSASVSCIVEATGQPCDQVVVPFKDCGDEEMVFTFTYCNKDSSIIKLLNNWDTSGNIDIDFHNLPVGTMAFIHTSPQDLNLDDLYPGECRTIVKTRNVNTCLDRIDASLKIEGWRGDGNEGDYCYAWNFYRYNIERPNDKPPSKAPSPSPPSCNVRSKVSCIVANTGERCEDLTVPMSECGIETFKFSFEYCNYEESESVDLIYGDNTGNNIDMFSLPRGTMAFVFRSPVELSIEELPPRVCRTIVAKRTLSTCRPTIEASLKVEGWRGAGEVGDYCFGKSCHETFLFIPTWLL